MGVPPDVKVINQSLITLTNPVTIEHWKNFLYKANSPILKEKPEEYETLKILNVDYGQGYLFAKPNSELCNIDRSWCRKVSNQGDEEAPKSKRA